jgi:hypothetical protein
MPANSRAPGMHPEPLFLAPRSSMPFTPAPPWPVSHSGTNSQRSRRSLARCDHAPALSARTLTHASCSHRRFGMRDGGA